MGPARELLLSLPVPPSLCCLEKLASTYSRRSYPVYCPIYAGAPMSVSWVVASDVRWRLWGRYRRRALEQ
eukprot:COSAG02_NODE_4939_length_4810_cov_2.026746_2_plen_70_part_00